METLPHDWLALVALVFVLGLKHGLDPEHLVAIDGLTRFNAQADRRLARWCGALFSLGHGAVVIGVALAVGVAAERWVVPGWLEDLGTWISVGFLTALGLANLCALLGTPANRVVSPVGLRGRLFGRLTRTSRPAAIALVGALFALSFDTLSQAALFAVTATQLGGWAHSVALGLVFMLGMTAVDGANGLWIASLLRDADTRARIASRVLGLAVAGLSLGVVAFIVAERYSAPLGAWAAGRELAFGASVIGVVAAASLLGLALARRSLPEPRSARRG
ncbi:MAG TPA: nickel transporter [Burkholderiales bacterium]|nr:nickel transporter [Burkholderiales bacterium]